MENLKFNAENAAEQMTREGAKDLGAQALKVTEYEATEHADVKFWAGEYVSTERDFDKQYQPRISEKEMLVWEQGAKYNFDQMTAYANKEGLDRYTRDDVERIAMAEPGKTIEARAGKFYDARRDRLMAKIPKDATSDLEKVQMLPMLVMEHIAMQYDQGQRSFDPAAYQANRRRAHNNMIKGLNDMNSLAEKYGTERFTFRDFETNDFVYHRELDRSGETNARAEYDRSIVEAYARNAFSREFEQAERDARR